MAGKHFKEGSSVSKRSGAGRTGYASGSHAQQQKVGVQPVDTRSSSKRRKQQRRRKKSKAPRIIGAIVAVVLLAVVVWGGLLVHSAYGMLQDAKEIYAQVEVVKTGLENDDALAIQDAAAIVEEDAASLDEAMSSPVWTIACHLPVVGTDVSNVRTLVALLDQMATEVIVPAADCAEYLSLKALIQDKTFNLEAIGELVDLVDIIVPAVAEAQDVVGGLEEGSISQLNDAIEKVDSLLDTADSLLDYVTELTPYIEDMLGASGTRTYLILAHNPAELKSSGGYIGSVGTITITDGTFELGDFQSFNDANVASKNNLTNRLELTDEEESFFTWSLGSHAGSSGIDPDFSREGELSKQFWELEYGGQIDGAIGLDTTVLGYLLGLVGEVTTSDGTVVTAENCVQVLGYDVYWEYFTEDSYDSDSNDLADAVFSEIASLAFDQIVDNIGSVSLEGLIEVITTSVDEDRLMLWMDDDDEQAAMENLGLACTINTDETIPEIGIFLDSRTTSKLGWWTTLDTTYELVSENEDGSRTYNVTVELTNSITAQEVEDGATYLVGKKKDGAVSYMIYLYAPAGGTISDIKTTSDTVTTEATYQTLNGNAVGKIQFTTAASSTETLTFTVTTSTVAEGDLQVRQTPTAQGNTVTNADADATEEEAEETAE